MWAIRILSGPQAGQIFPINGGQHRLGRAPQCEIKIDSNSVSKEHAAVLVTGDKLILTDMNSRNGTFVNGVRVQNQRLDVGDKISLHDILLEVLQVSDGMRLNRPLTPSQGVYSAPPPSWAGNAAMQLDPYGQENPQAGGHSRIEAVMNGDRGFAQEPARHLPPMAANSLGAVFYNFKIYIDNVAMPGVYALVKTMPFRYSILALIAIYVVIVTALSTVPVVNTTKQNIKMESVRRARTIARNMAAINRQGAIEDNETKMSVRQAELEEGVTVALILRAKDGTIMAPANRRGDYVNKAFVNNARREEKSTWAFIDDSNLGVSEPITVYSADSGNQTVVAYAIVLYDMGSLAINASQTFSLFIETLAMALIVAFLLYFFITKIAEDPIEALNAQLDDALREGRDEVSTQYKYAPIEKLVSNINSALSRIDLRGGAEGAKFVADRDAEAANVVRMLTAAAIAVNAIDDRVISTNTAFDRLVGGGLQLAGQPLTVIPDPALQENLRDLIPRMRGSIAEVASSEIPFSGIRYTVNGHAVLGAEGPAYYLIVLSPQEGS